MSWQRRLMPIRICLSSVERGCVSCTVTILKRFTISSSSYQDRILFGTDHFLPRDEKLLSDADELRRWQGGALFYGRHLEYFETDHVGLFEPSKHYGAG